MGVAVGKGSKTGAYRPVEAIIQGEGIGNFALFYRG